jgi:hypothetical protein
MAISPAEFIKKWSRVSHAELDAAVSAAYGWPDGLAPDDIIARLLERNQAASPSKI